jgi:hypothetical protein
MIARAERGEAGNPQPLQNPSPRPSFQDAAGPKRGGFAGPNFA